MWKKFILGALFVLLCFSVYSLYASSGCELCFKCQETGKKAKCKCDGTPVKCEVKINTPYEGWYQAYCECKTQIKTCSIPCPGGIGEEDCEEGEYCDEPPPR
jgi:hypothetical protein